MHAGRRSITAVAVHSLQFRSMLAALGGVVVTVREPAECRRMLEETGRRQAGAGTTDHDRGQKRLPGCGIFVHQPLQGGGQTPNRARWLKPRMSGEVAITDGGAGCGQSFQLGAQPRGECCRVVLSHW